MARLAIIGGTGALGAALAGRLARAGHEIWIGSRDAVKAEQAAVAFGGHGAGIAEATAAAEICFLTVPYAAHGETLALMRDAAAGKIVVDATVPLKPPKVGTVQLPAAGCAALEAAALLGGDVQVVSALQNIGAEKLASPGLTEADVLVCGDAAGAVEIVCSLLRSIGLKCWHAGPLANAAAAEAMTSVLIQINRRYKMVQAGLRITGRVKDAPAAPGVAVLPVTGLKLFDPGDDIGAAIDGALRAAGVSLLDGDVLVVAQKIVSKSEGRRVALNQVAVGAEAQGVAERTGKPAAIAELILRESAQLVRTSPGVIIARHRTGHVLANAGIDASNLQLAEDGDSVLLWPADPDASARRLRVDMEARSGAKLAVVISDSLGRAWRMGTTGSAIGSSGLKPTRDRRGESDLFGRTLQATIVGVADEIAAAASLVMGEAAEGVPAAIVRGAIYERDLEVGIGSILRPLNEDLFR